MSSLLALRNVSKLYGERLILKKISCEVMPGEITLIIGSNGAGKSTLLRIMAGLSKPDSGSLERAPNLAVAYLGHATYLYPALSAYANLAFWAKAHKLNLNNEQLMLLLTKVQLQDFARETVRNFSRGMAQRLNFARALMLNPALFLLDEPFTGMDAQSQTLMRAELKQRQKDGACIILVSHSLAQDQPIADNILALAKRSVAYYGPAANYAET